MEKELERITKKNLKKHYQGKETRFSKRINLLRMKSDKHDYLRWTILPKALQKGMESGVLKYF